MPAKKKASKKSTAGEKKPKSDKPRAEAVRGTLRAGTSFPPATCTRIFRRSKGAMRTSTSAGAYMAGVLDYLVAEVLELACEEMHFRK